MNAASPLGELLAYIAEAKSGCHLVGAGSGTERHGNNAAELPSIDYFRRTWSKVSTNRLLRESQAHVPDNAGPLNSSQLVHRALSVMRDVSPDYLHHMLLYVDALSWMEQLKEGSKSSGAAKGNRTKGGGNGLRRSGVARKELVGNPR